ncbi:hypothetical protein ALC62_14335 [Cyphomyrmex costatus]|uniref:Uncharacterized protein n=1 Tax=Cyphomyrmex costatus TaxID=456900 RepID=A0A151I8R8_9HYME|nr:hypothetical protein ALC62_14335 [Cyphomyrmex costatus]
MVVLILCLRGEARTVLKGIQNLEDLDFVALKTKLENCATERHNPHRHITRNLLVVFAWVINKHSSIVDCTLV